MTANRQTSMYVAGIGLLVSVAVVLQMMRERTYADGPAVPDEVLYIDSGPVIERVALSYKTVLADLYWIRALQHYGRERLKPDSTGRFALLYPLLNLTTSLDPRFTLAYRFGAIFLAEPYPGGAGKPELAIRLLEKGIRTTPAKWEYYHDVGFVYFWNLHDYLKGADWFRRGSEQPGSPWWLRTYAAALMAKGGDRQTARVIWRNILSTSEGAWIKETARKRLLQLDLADLPERQRSALILRELNGLSHQEIGVVLELSTSAVKQAIFDARSALFSFREGREMACQDVRRMLSDGDGRVLRGRGMRGHLRACPDCRRFRAASPSGL